VIERFAELDGDHYEILSPAADALAAKHPLAAILLLRAMIEFALKENSTGTRLAILRNARASRLPSGTSAASNRISVTAHV
jgi:hypothetical protein